MTKAEPVSPTVEAMDVDEIPFEDRFEGMEVDEPAPELYDGKISLIAGAPTDMTAATYQFTEEDHTLGNALRWIVAKDPQVEYVGYSIPHPSEKKMNFRIQTLDGKDTRQVLDEGLSNLMDMCDHVTETFQIAFAKNEFETLPDERNEVNKKVAEMLAAKKK